MGAVIFNPSLSNFSNQFVLQGINLPSPSPMDGEDFTIEFLETGGPNGSFFENGSISSLLRLIFVATEA
ncbi:MAG: hypothetical protein R2795_13760 [Saprospiraceae bacterium]